MTLSGNPTDYLIAFFGGILVSFTPCVYPLIPISAGYIGASGAGSKLKGFILSFIYVTGVAVTYSILGLVASLTGSIFGKISSHPVTHIAVGLIIILFGLSMMDLFNFSLPNIIRLPVLKKENYFSTFFLGLSSGLIVSSFLTPVLSSTLLYLATKKNLFYGATLLLSFAYGMGMILLLSGTFSSILVVSLPKSNKWLATMKKISALILLAVGLFFVYNGARRI